MQRIEAGKTVLRSADLDGKGKHMTKLVEQLKQEHHELKAQVAAIKQRGVMTPEGFAGLLHLRYLLQGHIAHEAQNMYPRLERAAKQDEAVRSLLARFAEEMNEITHEAARFFDMYTAPTRSLDFARDVARIFSMITNRIITEEAVLYPRLAGL